MLSPLRAAAQALCLSMLALVAAACSSPAPTATPTATLTPTPTPMATPTRTPGANPQPASVSGQLASGGQRFAVVEGSEARYMVREQLAGVSFPNDAIGQTAAISGAIVLGPDNTVVAEQSRFSVDLSTLKSDRDQRDNYIKRNTLDTARFPLAEFIPREFVGLPSPLPTEGQASFQMIGDMTVHGVTSPVTWGVTASFSDGAVTGQAATEFDFAKFGMTRPRVQIVLSVEDNIRLQVDFVLRPAE